MGGPISENWVTSLPDFLETDTCIYSCPHKYWIEKCLWKKKKKQKGKKTSEEEGLKMSIFPSWDPKKGSDLDKQSEQNQAKTPTQENTKIKEKQQQNLTFSLQACVMQRMWSCGPQCQTSNFRNKRLCLCLHAVASCKFFRRSGSRDIR